MTKINTLPFKELFEMYGANLPSRAHFLGSKNVHKVSAKVLKDYYGEAKIPTAWNEFVRDYTLYATEFAKQKLASLKAKKEPINE